jgi:hypothetical protein
MYKHYMKFAQLGPNDLISQKEVYQIGDEVISLFPMSNEGLSFTDMSDEVYKQSRVIFCKTDFLGILFERLRKCDHLEHILITHHSDYEISQDIWSHKPTCIKKWYAQNAIHQTEGLIPLPIFLETPLPTRKKFYYLQDNFQRLANNQKEFSIYCAWDTGTSPERLNVMDRIKGTGLTWTNEQLPFEEYINNMSKHKFVASPRGNGTDCHRTWEALYVGCIPIVIRHKMYDEWSDLPILQIDDWSDLNREMLEEFSSREFNYEKLSLSYWRDRIRTF